MTKKYRAVLINPHNKHIEEVEYNGDYKQIYEHIQADLFTTLQVSSDRDTLFLDDEGLYAPDQAFFQWVGYPQPLAGRALLLGTGNQGSSIDAKMSLEQVTAHVLWLDGMKVRL